MRITIELHCPRCQKTSIVRNGKKSNLKQNYKCIECGRQFIADHERKYKGTQPQIPDMIHLMLVRGVGVRDRAAILSVSINKVMRTLASSTYKIKPKKTHYDTLEIDEFWTYIGKKKNKL